MNRFDWLEIPAWDLKKESPVSTAAPLLDARHYLQSAEQSWRRGNFEGALRFYARALGQDSGLEEAWLGQVRCLIDLDEIKEARVWVNKALEKLPHSADLLSAKALVLSKMFEDEPAMELSDRALSLKQYTWYLWLCRGFILLKTGDRNAEYCMVKALEANPEDWFINLRVGMAYLGISDYHKALLYLRKAIRVETTNPLVLLKFGFCCEKLGWPAQARLHYQKALETDGELRDEILKALRSVSHGNLWVWLKGVFNRQKLEA
jgi:tetratricopeptide (TPR) repeat protein